MPPPTAKPMPQPVPGNKVPTNTPQPSQPKSNVSPAVQKDVNEAIESGKPRIANQNIQDQVSEAVDTNKQPPTEGQATNPKEPEKPINLNEAPRNQSNEVVPPKEGESQTQEKKEGEQTPENKKTNQENENNQQPTQEEDQVRHIQPQPEEEQSEEEPVGDDVLQKGTETGMQFALFIPAITIAIIKDVVELIIFFIPIIDFLSFIISIPLGFILGVFLFFSGRKGKFQNMNIIIGTIADLVPFLSAVPTSTILTLITFVGKRDPGAAAKMASSLQKAEKNNAVKKKTGEMANKLSGAFKKFTSKI